MIIILKNNLWSFKRVFFCDQTHGRTNKLPIKIIIFFLVTYWSIETLGEAILNLSGQIDLPITLETSHYLFNM